MKERKAFSPILLTSVPPLGPYSAVVLCLLEKGKKVAIVSLHTNKASSFSGRI